MASVQKQQRSTRNIRSTIHILLSILSECGVPRVPTECLRQAKFNQKEAVGDIWSLIFHILQVIQYLEIGHHEENSSGGTLDSIPFHPITHSNLEVVQMIVRRYLSQQGYGREEFYATSAEKVGSRELLFALAWLIHRKSFFAKLTVHFLTVAKTTQYPLKPTVKSLLVEQTAREVQNFRSELARISHTFGSSGWISTTALSSEAYTEALHKLVWLRGRLNRTQNSVESLCAAYQTVAHKIQHASTVTSPSLQQGKKKALSLHQVFLLRYPSQLKAHLDKMEQCVNMLQKLLEWQQYEPLFWKWMESVLDVMLQEAVRKESKSTATSSQGVTAVTTASKPSKTEVLEDLGTLASKVESLRSKFERLMESRGPHFDKARRVWTRRCKVVPKRDIETKEELTKRQLELEYPMLTLTTPTNQGMSVVSSMMEQISEGDAMGYLPVCKSPQVFLVSAKREQEVVSKHVRVLQDRLKAVTREVRTLEEKIIDKRLEIRTSLEALEQKLPSTLCKIESNSVQQKNVTL